MMSLGGLQWRQLHGEQCLSDPLQSWDTKSNKKIPTDVDCRQCTTRHSLRLDLDHVLVGGKAPHRLDPSPGAGHGESRRVRSEGDSQAATWTKLFGRLQLNEAVHALDPLVQQGTFVDTSIFYDFIKRCTAEKDIVLGCRIHALAVKCGYESNAFLANHIIRMYSSYGRVEEAMEVFRRVPAPDHYMWASILLVHARHGQPKEAITLYWQMRGLNINADNHILVAVLKACGAAEDLCAGRKVHADMAGTVCEPNVFVGNSLINMYAKCGSLEGARNVFDGLSVKDVVTWNAMISGYVQHGLGDEALTLYGRMQNEGITLPDAVTFICLLKACSSVQALHHGKQLHAHIRERRLEADSVVGNGLINMYAKCGSLKDARRVFDNHLKRDVLTWTTMITGYAQNGFGQEALSLYGSMQQEGIISADAVTFVSLLEACASVGSLSHGRQLHSQIQQRGLEADVIVSNCLVNMYAKCGSLEDARKVFDYLQTRDVVTWNAMIGAYVQNGRGQDALALYSNMQLQGMPLADNVTFVCLLQACATVGALYQGKQLHAEIQERGLEADMVVGNSLVNMYAKCGRLEEAQRVFNRLPARNVVTWSALLIAYAQHCDGQMAILCFAEMLQQGIKPNDTTFLCLLVACSHAGLVHEGQRYFKMMKDHGITPTVNHYNCMVDLLARSGLLNEAETMLLTMPYEYDVVGWTSLLSACKSYGDVECGRRCFNYLVGLEPANAGAYVLLCNIYANAGRSMDVYNIESMRKRAGAWKKPAQAFIEVKNRVHEFTVGDERSDVSSKLKSMNVRLKQEGGHVPQTVLVLKAVCEEEKEDALCGHAEKLALAYGLLNTSDGTTLLVTKNLRMCNDCHSSTKVMSSLEKREIIVRDAHRVHRFVDGSCSCLDRH